jgi:hypothetical protein
MIRTLEAFLFDMYVDLAAYRISIFLHLCVDIHVTNLLVFFLNQKKRYPSILL